MSREPGSKTKNLVSKTVIIFFQRGEKSSRGLTNAIRTLMLSSGLFEGQPCFIKTGVLARLFVSYHFKFNREEYEMA